ncbi:MAG: hypothetical protein DMF80_01515 [Acidobacteria bacterium]|nr:MAG: hypothetical protein DMF80_01515 [Acidobacteriota bacterium]
MVWGEIEAIAVDDDLGYVYYADEDTGVRKYHADPDAPDAGRELAMFGTTGYRQDREGLGIYALPGGKGYIISVDQLPGESVFHVYRREGEPGNPHDHSKVLLSFKGGADATDGLDVTSAALGPDFPDGLLAAMSSRSRNFLLFRWRDIGSPATARGRPFGCLPIGRRSPGRYHGARDESGPPMTSPLRVAVVGCGGIAQMMHLPTLAERPDLFAIAALADVNRATLDAVSRRYGVATAATDYREVVARPDVDAVLLLASGSHKEAALAALEAGKHLFVEKPLGFGVPETEEIAEAARRSRGRLMVGYHKRFDPAYLKAREEVRSLGDLRYVEVTVLHPDDAAHRTHHALLPVAERPWSPAPEETLNEAIAAEARQGSAAAAVAGIVGEDAPTAWRVAAFLLSISLIHDVDAVRGILGEPEEVVSAHVWQDGFAQTSLSRFGRARVSLSWISLPGLKHYEERLRFVSPDKRITLVFPSPYLRHFPTALEIERMQGEELVVERHTVSYEEAFRVELHHFRRCLAEGIAPAPSIDDALGDARWIEAIARAYGRSSRASAK